MNRTIKHQESFNTNNGWGFGGAIGTLTVYNDGFSTRQGKACFRHLPCQKFTRYFNPAGEEISRETFSNYYNKGKK